MVNFYNKLTVLERTVSNAFSGKLFITICVKILRKNGY